MERLVLPSPASVVWARTADTVQEHFGGPDETGPGFAIGGGTILAARWGHRRSDDVDVKVTVTGLLQQILTDPTALRALDAQLERAGFRQAELHRPLQVVYCQGTHPGAPALDLFEGDLSPTEPIRWSLIQDEPVPVASNRQILCGKTRGRAERAPVRDLFDLAVSTVHDNDAAETAINAMRADILATIPIRWERRQDEYRQDANTRLLRVPEHYDAFRADPAGTASRAVRELAWRQIDIAYTPKGAMITGYRPGEQRLLHQSYITTPQAIAEAFTTLGVPYGHSPATGQPWPAEHLLKAQRTGTFTITEH